MTRIEQIRQEIERRHKYQSEQYHITKPDGRPNDGWAESLAIMGELEEILNFLDTLEQPQLPSDVEEAAEKGASQYYIDGGYSPFPNVETTAYKAGFKEGAEWQKEQMLQLAKNRYENANDICVR